MCHEQVYVPCREKVTTGRVAVPKQYQTKGSDVPDSNAIGYSQKTKEAGAIYLVPQEYLEFTHSIEISIYNNQDMDRENIVWSGVSMATNQDASFINYSDYLLVSLFNRFGQGSDGVIKEKLVPKVLTEYWE